MWVCVSLGYRFFDEHLGRSQLSGQRREFRQSAVVRYQLFLLPLRWYRATTRQRIATVSPNNHVTKPAGSRAVVNREQAESG